MSTTENLKILSDEVEELSREIYLLKKKHNRTPDGLGKDELKKTIKAKQYQALWYIEKIENLARSKKAPDC